MNHRKGFTLIELLVAIAIIGVLATIVLASIKSAQSKARDKRMQSEVRSLRTALDLYYARYGSYPSTGGGYTCTAGSGINNCVPGTGTLQVLVTEGFISKLPIGTGADGSGVDETEIYYGSPGWWNSSWPYQIQFQLENRDDTAGECNGGSCSGATWNGRYMYSVH